jgi:hypothetical protein
VMRFVSDQRMNTRLKFFLSVLILSFTLLAFHGVYTVIRAQEMGLIQVRVNRSTVKSVTRLESPQAFAAQVRKAWIKSAALLSLAVCVLVCWRRWLN